MKKLIIFCSLCVALHANACLNIFSIDSAGNIHHLEHSFLRTIQTDRSFVAGKVKKLEQRFSTGKYSYKDVSDYGAYLLMAGRFAEGLELFQGLTKKYGTLYEICANAAVAWELNGNIDSALYWERKALSINPRAHNHSEWIHLKILEAKKELQSDPDWCLKNQVTHVMDSVKKYYRHEEHELSEGAQSLTQFVDQLNERLQFTYGEDKVMGKLLLETGDAYQAASLYRAYYCYAMAKYFYPALTDATNTRMQKIKAAYPPPPPAIGKKKFNHRDSRELEEKLAPTDAEVQAFINKLKNRPAITNKKVKPLAASQLLSNI
jgi:hypothetical protein